MKIFISWSGVSKNIALALQSFLENIFPDVKIFMSENSLEKGGRSINDIHKELSETDYGICCLTETNVNAPWIAFEAGAISKDIEKSKVPILFGTEEISSKSPLVQFQGILNWNNKEEFKKHMQQLFEEIKKSSGNTLSDKQFEILFDKSFSEFIEIATKEVAKENKSHETQFSQNDSNKITDLIEEKFGKVENMLYEFSKNVNESFDKCQKIHLSNLTSKRDSISDRNGYSISDRNEYSISDRNEYSISYGHTLFNGNYNSITLIDCIEHEILYAFSHLENCDLTQGLKKKLLDIHCNFLETSEIDGHLFSELETLFQDIKQILKSYEREYMQNYILSVTAYSAYMECKKKFKVPATV